MHAGLLPSGSAINRDPPACFHVSWGGTSIGCTGNLLFQICLRTWGPLFKECRSSTQKINNNKQCRCLALCAPLGGLGFSPHLSHPTGDAPKQRNKQKQKQCLFLLLLLLVVVTLFVSSSTGFFPSFLPCGLDCILSPHTHTLCVYADPFPFSLCEGSIACCKVKQSSKAVQQQP